MAEEFLSKLNQLEERIDGIGETLKRMITVLAEIGDIKAEISTTKAEIGDTKSEVGEIKTQLSQMKEEIVTAIQSQTPTEPSEGAGGEVIATISAEFEKLAQFISEALQGFQAAITESIQSISVAAPAPVAATLVEPIAGAPVSATGSLPVDKAMKVADQLEKILKSLKMGCVAKDVTAIMTDAKEEILKIVPSDPVMVKIDKWIGTVGAYPKRNELQAKDILKLKKEIKGEIPKYRPA